MNYLLVLLGYLMFIILGMMKTKRKHPDIKFDPLIYLKDEILTLVLSALSAITIMLLRDDIGDVIMTEKVFSFCAGFFNYAIIDRLVNIWYPKKIKTD